MEGTEVTKSLGGEGPSRETKRGGLYVGPDQLYCSESTVTREQDAHTSLGILQENPECAME